MNRDLIAGGALVLAGGVYAGYAMLTLPLGSLRQMGAGLFPTALGVLLALIGLCIALHALVRAEAMPELRPRALIAVLASIVAFAILIRTAGLIVSVTATTVLASMALPGRRPVTVVLLCLVLTGLCWVIFIQLLSLPIPLIRVPFP